MRCDNEGILLMYILTNKAAYCKPNYKLQIVTAFASVKDGCGNNFFCLPFEAKKSIGTTA